MTRRLIDMILATVVFLSFCILFSFSGTASAVSSAGFQAGRIMDDGILYTSGTMSVNDIQTFMNSKVPVCDTYHTPTSNPRDSGQPYICLKEYRQDIPAVAADAYCSGSIDAATNASSAYILHEVSRACNINVKALLVLIQKEQSLLTDDWPWQVQYTKTTGMGCPDSSLGIDVDANQNGCYDEYEGFFKQVYYAARQLQRYIKQPHLFNVRVGTTRNIAYNPNAGCGSSPVYIQTQATAALYNYTPYQPNVAALNNLYGTGDGCSAYGNRNFWRIYNDWFGPTTSDSDAHTLGIMRLNHSSGRVEYLGLSSISSYAAVSRNILASYPAVPADGSVIPLINPRGDLSLIRLNHSSGRSEIVTLSASSSFQEVIDYQLTAYPAVALPGEAPDGSVVPMFWPNGDLVFLRLNHASGRTELVSLSAGSRFQQVVNYQHTAYPAIAVPGEAPDGTVIPLFNHVGNLMFMRLNHTSGRVEVVTIGAAGGFQQMIDYQLSVYPAVADYEELDVVVGR